MIELVEKLEENYRAHLKATLLTMSWIVQKENIYLISMLLLFLYTIVWQKFQFSGGPIKHVII